MIKLVEMDEKVTLSTQMDEDKNGPVIVINKFNVKPENIDSFLKAWTTDAEIMKRQPGFISTQLHRGIAGSSVFINYAVWESAKYLKLALNNPEFQSTLNAYPVDTIVSPHLFRKVAVPGICVD
jgi:heme-degrading monooxygenase HmoA